VPDRVYAPEVPTAGPLRIEGPEAHHLVRVKRAQPDETVELFDGRGGLAEARIASVGRNAVQLEVTRTWADPVGPSGLTIATAVPKGERFDWLVEKATELGADRLIPLRTTRSVVDPGPAKLERLRKRIVEACKQSGRSRLMELEKPRDWSRVVSQPFEGQRFLAHPGGGSWPRRVSEGPARVAIGPEGGFSEDEVAAALETGWTRIGLGPTILRIETAALAVCAVWRVLKNPGDP